MTVTKTQILLAAMAFTAAMFSLVTVLKFIFIGGF
jgi:hypothetical protein